MIAAIVLAAASQYVLHCASCHGARLEGSPAAPPLTTADAALVDFELRTGRMPAVVPREPNDSGRVLLGAAQIAAIETYIAAHSSGSAALPTITQAPQGLAAIKAGRAVYEENCEQCHSAGGRGGGATAYHEVAPDLSESDPLTIAEAVREGPNVMPRFGPGVINDRQLADLTAYVRYLQERKDHPGGLMLANWGPVAEGFAAWMFGFGALAFFARRLGD